MPKSKGRAKKSGKSRVPKDIAEGEAKGKNPMADEQATGSRYRGEFSPGAQQQTHRRDATAFKRNARGR